MSADWRTRTVKQLQDEGVLLVEDGNHGEYRPRPDEFVSEGIPFIRAADLDGGRILFTKASRINEAALNRIRKGIGAPGDILLSHKGTVGKLAVAPVDCEPFVCSPQTTFWRVLDDTVIDRRFLYSYMHSHDFRQQLDAIKGETDMADYASLTAQRRFVVPVIDIDLQRSIGFVLGALDDKIALNRRMNKTLEAAAQAIFTDWFIDFGPTRSKMAGGSSYLSPDLWRLFSDRIDDYGKPTGWALGTLEDVAQQVGETVKPNTLDPGTPYFGLEHLPRKSISLSDWGRAGKVISGKIAFQKYDLLFGKLRPYFHKVGIAPVSGICSTDIVVLNSRKRKASAFVLACVSRSDFVAFTDRTSDGTKMPRTSWDLMKRYGICVPNDPVLEAFNACVGMMYERIIANVHESHTLASTRDLLLPKLMAGDLSVAGAERKVGELV